MLIIMVSEQVLVHGLVLIKIFCIYSSIMYYICCHVVAINELNPFKDYENVSYTSVPLAD